MQPVKRSLLLPFLEFLFLFLTADNIASFYTISAHFSSLQGVDYGPYLLTRFDESIPFVLIFFPFYISEYLVLEFLILSTAIFVDFNRHFTRQFFCGCIFISIVSTILFLVFPTSLFSLAASAGQPQIEFFNHLFSGFNSYILPPFNSFPSLHLASAWFCIRIFQFYFPESKMKKIALWTLVIWFIGMALSTLTLKYHYLIDDLGGIILAEFAYWLVVVKNIGKVERWNEFLAEKRLLIVEFSLLIVTTLILYWAYPDYMQLGVSLSFNSTPTKA